MQNPDSIYLTVHQTQIKKAAQNVSGKVNYMEFFNSAVETLQTLVVALGGALCVWGGINLLEGYGQDNRAIRS